MRCLRTVSVVVALTLAAGSIPQRVAGAPPARDASRAGADPTLPSVLIQWPLEPVARGPAAQAPARPAHPPPQRPPDSPPPVTQPSTAPPDDEPLLAPPIAATPRGSEPDTRPPPAATPEGGVVASVPERATPSGEEPPVLAPAPPAVATTQPPARGKPSGEREDDHIIDLGLLAPEIRAPRVGELLPPATLTPPTEDVRRWTIANPPGVTWEAEEQSKEGDWIILRGHVDVRHGLERIQADEVRWNLTTNELQADGNVVLDRLDSRLTGSKLEYDLDTNTGLVHDALGYTGDEQSFTAAFAEKVGPDKYILRQGAFTSCTQPSPIWQVRATKAIVHVDHFVYMWNPRLFFKKVPAHYLPWVAFPIKQDRTTGFMIPKMSNSSKRGFSVEEEFFWAINRSADLTVGGRGYTEGDWRGNLEGRWHLNGMTDPGSFEALYLHEPIEEADEDDFDLRDDRWGMRWEHRQDIGQWDMTLTGEKGTDQLIWAEQTGPLGSGTTLSVYAPYFNQRATLQRQWGKHSLNFYVENNEEERAGNVAGAPTADVRRTETDRNIPLAEYRASGIQIGGRKWLSLTMEGSAGWLHRGIANDVDLQAPAFSFVSDEAKHDYPRLDFYPQLRMPMGFTWLQVIPEVGVRGTWWGRRELDFDPATLSNDAFPVDVQVPGGTTVQVKELRGEDEGVFAWAWDGGLNIEGPDFERIFRPGAAPGRKRWQHLIEPAIEFDYAPKIDKQPLISSDQRTSHYTTKFLEKTNRARLRLTQTLRNKRALPPGSTEESARDWLIWNLSTDYDFEKARSIATVENRSERNWFGNISSDLNWKPTDDIHFSLRNTYDVIQDDVTRTDLTGGVDGGWGYVDIAYSSQRAQPTLDATSTDLSLTGEHWFFKGDRVRLGYDLVRRLDEQNAPADSNPWLYRRLVASYYNQCLGISLSWEDQSHRQLPREIEWQIVVSLKDLGNYLRYRERNRE